MSGPTDIPSGTVTFVFTDIEGSTQRWDRNRAAMEAAVRLHDGLMRSAIQAHGGYVFKTIGDAFCAAFSRPEDAAVAMLEAQRALAATDFSAVDGLRVRAAIHTGTADERDRDYFGPAVNRVARLLGIAHGGQTLVSGVTSDLIQGSLPPEASLRDLGEHRLRDLAKSERVFQIQAPGLEVEFPPLRSLSVISNNLPSQVKSFVERDSEIADIVALIGRHRLVTLVGSGGIGKTRTSLQVAAQLLDGFRDGAWFIELAPLANGEFIASAVAHALGLTLPSEGDPTHHLGRALSSKSLLLLFDNCEHVLESAARVVSTLVRGCPELRVLATSRQALGIEGEATYRMPALAFPKVADTAALTAADARRYAAIALFVDRARSADSRFELTNDNAPFVADICRRLDGIALAIELAASRVKILGPRQLRDRLDERFRVLTGGSRDVLPRQQTLRALIDWSHDLLDARERTVFRRLGVFVNGFTLEGAVAIASDDELGEADVFDVLASLVDKSLVLAEPAGDSLRYRLLESTRAYASEKRADANESEIVASRHLDYLRAYFTELAHRSRESGRHAERFEALETELEDVRFALDRALAGPERTAGGRLLVEIGNVWEGIGLSREGVMRNESYLAALPHDESLLLAQISSALTVMLINASHATRALEVANRALGYARTSGDAHALEIALEKYARVNIKVANFDEAEKALVEVQTLPGALVDPLRKRLLVAWAQLYSFKNDLDAAARTFEQIRAEERALGNAYNEQVQVVNLSIVEHRRSQTQRAILLVREVLPGIRKRNDASFLGWTLSCLTVYLIVEGDIAAAYAAACEAIHALEAVDPEHLVAADTFELTEVLEHVALIRALRGDLSQAALLDGYADTAFRRTGQERDFGASLTYRRLTALLREGLAPEASARLAAEGAALSPEAAIALALEDERTPALRP